MKPIIEYGEYRAIIEYDEDDKIFVGTVIGISDSVSFHGQNIQEVEHHSKINVDNYVDMCIEFGKYPEKEVTSKLRDDLHTKLRVEESRENREHPERHLATIISMH